MSITYVLVGGENLMAFAKSIAPAGGALPGKWAFIVMFGGLELFLSMVSSLNLRLMGHELPGASQPVLKGLLCTGS